MVPGFFSLRVIFITLITGAREKASSLFIAFQNYRMWLYLCLKWLAFGCV
ncbi:TPA: hypothetical protein MFN42_001125 [Klebsiella quasipneumoniae subsp. quasipneumoniae]|nr:hypothetical protein [Klebsiella quasipneumoniae subsp. quasipneumoniae]